MTETPNTKKLEARIAKLERLALQQERIDALLEKLIEKVEKDLDENCDYFVKDLKHCNDRIELLEEKVFPKMLVNIRRMADIVYNFRKR